MGKRGVYSGKKKTFGIGALFKIKPGVLLNGSPNNHCFTGNVTCRNIVLVIGSSIIASF